MAQKLANLRVSSGSVLTLRKDLELSGRNLRDSRYEYFFFQMVSDQRGQVLEVSL